MNDEALTEIVDRAANALEYNFDIETAIEESGLTADEFIDRLATELKARGYGE